MHAADKFHWAEKVSRRDLQRLYESDAMHLLDEDLLERVMFMLHVRVLDMFEVRQAQQFGRVACRGCGAPVPQQFRMGSANREAPLTCDACGWRTTCGEFLASYTGKDLLPGSRVELFEEFLERFPALRTPQEKMLLLDWLIHSFHVQSGVSRRLVAMNVVKGSRDQLVELLSNLAETSSGQPSKDAWLVQENSPINKFRRRYPSHAKVLEAAARLGIQGRRHMAENELIAEILRLAPELAEEQESL